MSEEIYKECVNTMNKVVLHILREKTEWNRSSESYIGDGDEDEESYTSVTDLIHDASKRLENHLRQSGFYYPGHVPEKHEDEFYEVLQEYVIDLIHKSGLRVVGHMHADSFDNIRDMFVELVKNTTSSDMTWTPTYSDEDSDED